MPPIEIFLEDSADIFLRNIKLDAGNWVIRIFWAAKPDSISIGMKFVNLKTFVLLILVYKYRAFIESEWHYKNKVYIYPPWSYVVQNKKNFYFCQITNACGIL